MKRNAFLGGLGVWACLLYACSSSDDEIPTDRLLQMYVFTNSCYSMLCKQ